jgi:hypothetical protein
MTTTPPPSFNSQVFVHDELVNIKILEIFLLLKQLGLPIMRSTHSTTRRTATFDDDSEGIQE